MDQNPVGVISKGQTVLYEAVEKAYQERDQKSQDTAEYKAGTPPGSRDKGQT